MTADMRYDTVIRCDAPRCERRFHRQTGWDYARKRAAAEGWSYTGITDHRDLCPDHREGESDG